MLTTKRITWTQPPEGSTLDALYELEDAENAEGEPTPERQAQIDALRKELATAQVDELRFTLASLSVLTKSRYFAYVRAVEPWLSAQWPDEDDPERVRMTLTSYGAALVLASLATVDRRSRPVLDIDERDGWEPCDWPTEWSTVEGYLAAVAPALHDALAAAAHALNPQVMMRGNNEQAKKFGGVSGS